MSARRPSMASLALRRWQVSMRLSNAAAAALLGVDRRTFIEWGRGLSRSTGEPVAIPRAVGLACAGLAMGLPAWCRDPEALAAWLDTLLLSRGRAAKALGVDRRTVYSWLQGTSRATGRPLQPPEYIGRAMAALAAGLEPWGQAGAREPGDGPKPAET